MVEDFQLSMRGICDSGDFIATASGFRRFIGVHVLHVEEEQSYVRGQKTGPSSNYLYYLWAGGGVSITLVSQEDPIDMSERIFADNSPSCS